MINRKNKPVDMGLDINKFVNEVQQNKRPAATEIIPEDMQEQGVSEKETPLPPVETLISEADDSKEVKEENPKRKRTVPQKAIKRDKLVGVKFDKKTHKELCRIKLEYDIDIQDFIYAAVLSVKEQYFPNNKATKEGLAIIREQIDKVNGDVPEE